jgi:2',3'-cyclic-nucleotide 2'-phosphodiesterase (5'-nucleotidase family)
MVIGKLEGDLIKGEVGAGTLGNFVTDAIRAQSSVKLGKPVLLAITNAGGLRKNTIAQGQLRAADIFELLPFENALIEIDLTGEQLLKLLSGVVPRDAQSGAILRYRLNAEKRPELVNVKLINEGKEIDPKATYTIVTIDYLLNLASGNYSILQQGKNAKPLNITLRDAVTDYVKAETAAGRTIKAKLDDRFVSVDSDSKPEDQRK